MPPSLALPRRRFLRGLGTVVALPVLESLLPRALAQTGGAPAAPAGAGPRRLVFVYAPNGKNMADWTPAAEGADYALPPILHPLQAHQKDLLVLTGLAHEQGNALGDGPGDHARASAVFLTGVHPRKTAGADLQLGISADQIAANHLGHLTRLPSLELSCDRGLRAGACDSGYSCAYQYNISWKSETQPMMPEVEPRLAFERLFGSVRENETREARARRELYRKSVLDFVLDDAQALAPRLDASDRRKLDEYLSAVRALEQRIAQAEKFADFKAPVGRRPDQAATFQEHIRLMFDIQALALQSDTTRIITFIIGHDGSNRPYPQIGVTEGHHDVSHHRNDEAKKAQIAKINRYHVEQFAYFLDQLKAVPEGRGTLLDHCLIVYGSGISDGNAHSHTNLPVLVAGGGAGALRTGRHLRLARRTPMTNLYRSLLDAVGAPAERIGDSTGKLDTIFHPA